MRMYDLILKKRRGGELNQEEMHWMVEAYTAGKIPDYQMSAMLMAIYFTGMSDKETWHMTDAVAHSGEMVDLSPIRGVKIDKHSTGGVGDKTTLVVAPIVAACGVKVAKMSGRGLGHTGGTVDKLESIPGMRLSLEREEFFDVVNKTGLAVIGQSGNLAPADKKLYALRDVTATVDSIPLIAVSIMGKKLAAGNDGILLDVKTGSGAFMKTLEDSIKLAQCMVSIGENAGKRTAALITDMDIPLGRNIGNTLEVIEAIDTLKGEGPGDLTEVCLELASNMLYMAEKGSLEECRKMAKKSLADGSALDRFAAMVQAQGGDVQALKDTSLLKKAPYRYEVRANRGGYVSHMDTEACGAVSVMLGAGRDTADSRIDYLAGIVLRHKTGDWVDAGEVIAELYSSRDSLFAAAARRFEEAVSVSDDRPERKKLILARVDKDGVRA